uniref:TH1 domain-containing protein n=1 Tax=Salix viminalis TaxID=40686 RepID=A0A6N2KC79_SALVM
MNRYNRRVQVPDLQLPKYDNEEESVDREEGDSGINNGVARLTITESNVSDDQEPFMGVKVRRKASRHRDIQGDYLDVPSNSYLMKILQKQGDNQVLFADKVLKFTGSGKMKQRILLITDFAVYIVDPEINALKRRIALAAVEKICLSELSDNFFAIIIPTEYDLLMASTRKTEIVTVLVEATKSASDYELDVVFSNSFEYNADAELVKKIEWCKNQNHKELSSSPRMVLYVYRPCRRFALFIVKWEGRRTYCVERILTASGYFNPNFQIPLKIDCHSAGLGCVWMESVLTYLLKRLSREGRLPQPATLRW